MNNHTLRYRKNRWADKKIGWAVDQSQNLCGLKSKPLQKKSDGLLIFGFRLPFIKSILKINENTMFTWVLTAVHKALFQQIFPLVCDVTSGKGGSFYHRITFAEDLLSLISALANPKLFISFPCRVSSRFGWRKSYSVRSLNPPVVFVYIQIAAIPSVI